MQIRVLILQVPRKSVVLGKDAGFGPDIVYHDNLMLSNFTRMQEIHRNWQELFPSESNASLTVLEVLTSLQREEDTSM